MAKPQLVDLEFTKALPKIELHAHLTGSISRECLHEIWKRKKSEDPELALGDPLETLPIGKTDFNVKTFFPLFDTYIYTLINDLPSITTSTSSVLHSFQADGTRYLELRTTPRAHPSTNLTKDAYISTILSSIESFNASQSQLVTKLILSIDRRNTEAAANETVDLALKYRSRGVVGVDLCGDPAKALVVDLAPVVARAREGGLKVTVHFGETPASGTVEELSTLLAWQPERLGHVVQIPDVIKEEIERRRLGLELCLSCNVLAELTVGGFANHHFGEWRGRECPVVLCTDDVGIFCSPLSNEYLLAARHFGMTRRDVVALGKQAIGIIFGGEMEKDRLRRMFEEFERSMEV